MLSLPCLQFGNISNQMNSLIVCYLTRFQMFAMNSNFVWQRILKNARIRSSGITKHKSWRGNLSVICCLASVVICFSTQVKIKDERGNVTRKLRTVGLNWDQLNWWVLVGLFWEDKLYWALPKVKMPWFVLNGELPNALQCSTSQPTSSAHCISMGSMCVAWVALGIALSVGIVALGIALGVGIVALSNCSEKAIPKTFEKLPSHFWHASCYK